MDTSFLPLLLLILAWLFLGSKGRKKVTKKPGGKPTRPVAGSGTGAKPANPLIPAGKLDEKLAKEFPHLVARLEGAASHLADQVSGSLPRTEEEGKDPCHDDYAAMPSGSLRVNRAEGTDPCHDDYANLSSGSLKTDIPEGTDPCHDGWEAVPEPAAETRETGGGLGLSWAGNEIVKGFVYGEILKRRNG